MTVRVYDQFSYGSIAGYAPEADSPYRWQQDAACKGEDTDLFFDPNTYGIAAAFCSRCTVRDDCLEDAYRTQEFQSFRGGMSPRAREDVARKKRVRRTCALCPTTFVVPLRSDRVYCGTACQAKAKAKAQARHRKARQFDGSFRPSYPGEDEVVVNGVLGVLRLLKGGA